MVMVCCKQSPPVRCTECHWLPLTLSSQSQPSQILTAVSSAWCAPTNDNVLNHSASATISPDNTNVLTHGFITPPYLLIYLSQKMKLPTIGPIVILASGKIHFRVDEFKTFSFSQQGVKLEVFSLWLCSVCLLGSQHAQISS